MYDRIKVLLCYQPLLSGYLKGFQQFEQLTA